MYSGECVVYKKRAMTRARRIPLLAPPVGLHLRDILGECTEAKEQSELVRTHSHSKLGGSSGSRSGQRAHKHPAVRGRALPGHPPTIAYIALQLRRPQLH
jgi:hypothetical protein